MEEYYTHGSSEAYVPLIRTPSLFLVAEDDPFLGRLPILECSANPHTVLAVTSRFVHIQGFADSQGTCHVALRRICFLTEASATNVAV